MKKTIMLLAALLLCLAIFLPGAAEEAGAAKSEWTVMFYFCGSDLESGYGYASGNLEEISYCLTYDTISSAHQGSQDVPPAVEEVNVVFQTGGSKEWHAQNLGMEVKTDALQRWHFRPARNVLTETLLNLDLGEITGTREVIEALSKAIHDNAVMEPMQELPLASMADPETLSDFIRWSAETYPAEKYALVLWDHGMGAINGLFIDELFGGDSMSLDELKSALADSGVHFDAVLFDACLMANLETACAIRDSADWMIASEELVAGKGTAMNAWLQQLFFTPQWDGRRLGRWVCEMTQEKYAAEVSGKAEDTLTWSVIDLKKIDRLSAVFDRLFETIGQMYANQPIDMSSCSVILNEAFEFGLGDAEMIDLARIPFHTYSAMGLDRELYNELLDALMDAVVYNAHGPNRASAGGISFCYGAGMSPEALDAYARVCPSNHYLALLDAMSPEWEAPEAVYQQVEKLPEIVEVPDYRIRVTKGISSDGTPNISVADGTLCLRDVHVELSRLNPATGNIVRLGRGSTDIKLNVKDETVTYSVTDITTNWPTVDGVHCSAELISMDYLGNYLYHIPLMIGGETYLLRCGLNESDNVPVVYGFWAGYNADSGAFSRNVVPLNKMTGQDYTLLYPIVGTEGKDIRYESSEPLTLYRSVEISTSPLEPGTYYINFVVEDIFKRSLPVGQAEISWDGKTISIQGDAWQGEVVLNTK